MNPVFTYYKDFKGNIWRYDNNEKSWWVYNTIDREWYYRHEKGYSVKSYITGGYNDPLPILINPEDVFLEFI